MPVDGILLGQITSNIKDRIPLKINRITQPSQHEYIFQCFSKGRHNLYISTHPRFGRVQFTHLKSSSNIDLTHFLTILRQHVDGGIIQDIEQVGDDRIIIFTVSKRDDMGVIQEVKLILEVFSRYVNLVLIDEDNTIIDASRRMGSFESENRAIVPGATYAYPPSFDKKRLEDLTKEDMVTSIRTQYEGVSPILEKEITHRLKTQDPRAIVKSIRESNTLFVYDHDFHILELTHLTKPFKTYPLFEGLDTFYKDLLIEERIKAHTGNILKSLNRELKKSNKKLPKLYRELDAAENSDHFKDYGDLLFAYHADGASGLKEVTLNDWENNEVTIPLDVRYNGKENANLYFKRYRKAKNALDHLMHQIEDTENHIEYISRLIAQTKIASVDDAKEIHEELIEMGLIRHNQKKKAQPKRKKRPQYLVIEYDANTQIFVGKNNLQNDALTFKVGKKEDLWFHVAATFGAHVLLKTDDVTDEKLDLCANLAAYYSDAKHGSNVEVNYTAIKNIKKIPGATPGTVRFSTHKSVIITPDYETIKVYLDE